MGFSRYEVVTHVLVAEGVSVQTPSLGSRGTNVTYKKPQVPKAR